MLPWSLSSVPPFSESEISRYRGFYHMILLLVAGFPEYFKFKHLHSLSVLVNEPQVTTFMRSVDICALNSRG